MLINVNEYDLFNIKKNFLYCRLKEFLYFVLYLGDIFKIFRRVKIKVVFEMLILDIVEFRMKSIL